MKKTQITCRDCNKRFLTNDSWIVRCADCARIAPDKSTISDRVPFEVRLTVDQTLYNQLGKADRTALDAWLEKTQGTLQEEMDSRVKFALERWIAGVLLGEK